MPFALHPRELSPPRPRLWAGRQAVLLLLLPPRERDLLVPGRRARASLAFLTLEWGECPRRRPPGTAPLHWCLAPGQSPPPHRRTLLLPRAGQWPQGGLAAASSLLPRPRHAACYWGFSALSEMCVKGRGRAGCRHRGSHSGRGGEPPRAAFHVTLLGTFQAKVNAWSPSEQLDGVPEAGACPRRAPPRLTSASQAGKPSGRAASFHPQPQASACSPWNEPYPEPHDARSTKRPVMSLVHRSLFFNKHS